MKKIKRISCLGLIVIVLILGILIHFHPVFFVDFVKSLLNGSYGNELVVYQKPEKSFSDYVDLAEGTIELSEDDVYNIINSEDKDRVDRIEINENELILFRNIAESGTRPLWIGVHLIEEAGINSDPGNFKINRIGFGRIAFPEFITTRISDRFLGGLDSIENSNFIAGGIGKITGFDVSEIVKPENVELKENLIVIKVLDPGPLFELNSQNFNMENFSLEDIQEKIGDVLGL